ncbi:hypothetical protein ABZ390_46440, partial [Streptomyces solisilvae]
MTSPAFTEPLATAVPAPLGVAAAAGALLSASAADSPPGAPAGAVVAPSALRAAAPTGAPAVAGEGDGVQGAGDGGVQQPVHGPDVLRRHPA